MSAVVGRVRVFILLVVAAGAGGFLGSVLGGAFGRRALFIGGYVGGVVSCWLAVLLAGRLRWVPPHERKGTAVGAVMGFLAAATLAINTLSSPVGPLLSPLLVGIGGLLGSRFGAGVGEGRR